MKALVSDALWERLQPLLPPPPQRRFRFPGRKRLDYRKILTGILFVLKTGIAWDDLPAELGCGCGKTCRHYLRLWHQAGVWLKLHAVLLAELNEANQIDWERALIDASFAKAPEGGQDTGPSPTDRRKSGSKHHVLTDAQGIPLAATVTAANVNEVTQVVPVLTAMPPVGGTHATFTLNGDRISVRGGRCTRQDGRLAGSCLDMASAVRNCVRLLGASLTEALRFASNHPAEFLGLGTKLGRIAPGLRADLVAIDCETLEVHQTWVAGERE